MNTIRYMHNNMLIFKKLGHGYGLDIAKIRTCLSCINYFCTYTHITLSKLETQSSSTTTNHRLQLLSNIALMLPFRQHLVAFAFATSLFSSWPHQIWLHYLPLSSRLEEQGEVFTYNLCQVGSVFKPLFSLQGQIYIEITWPTIQGNVTLGDTWTYIIQGLAKYLVFFLGNL